LPRHHRGYFTEGARVCPTRRDFLKIGTLGGSGLFLTSKLGFMQRTFGQAVVGGFARSLQRPPDS
jgi:hypothetical protein